MSDPLPTTAFSLQQIPPLVAPHSEGHEENGGDPVLMPIRYLGTASTTAIFSDNSGTFADVPDLTLTAQTRGGTLLIIFRGRVDVIDIGGAGYTIRAVIDGTPLRVNNFAGSSTKVATGIIAIWSGSTASIPTGWQICDGTNGTPDLRDKFVVGAGTTYAVGATGGSATQADHTGHGAHGDHDTHATHDTHSTHSNQGFVTGIGANALDLTTDSGAHSAHSAHSAHNAHTNNSSISSHGTNLPPYHALAYIQRVTDEVDNITDSGTNIWLTEQLPNVHTIKIQARSAGASTVFTIDEDSDLIVFELLPVRRG